MKHGKGLDDCAIYPPLLHLTPQLLLLLLLHFSLGQSGVEPSPVVLVSHSQMEDEEEEEEEEDARARDDFNSSPSVISPTLTLT